MNDELMELPEGWEWSELQNLFKWSNGKSLTKQKMEAGKYSVFGGNGITGTHITWLCDHAAIIIGRVGAHCGNVHLSPPCSWITDNAIYSSYVSSAIDLSFFQMLLSHLKLNDLSGGSGQPYVSQDILNHLLVPLPPIAEQKRIVAKIEELRDRSQTARQALAAIPMLCDRFRQSVLAAAFRRELTADWREENPDAQWEETVLGEIIKGKPRNGYSPQSVDYPTKIKSLTLSATTSGKFKPEHSKYVDIEVEADSHLWLSPGDILIQRSNSLDYVGTSAIYNGEFGEFIYPDLMMKVQLLREKAIPKFIHYTLSAKSTREYFKANATGTAGNMPKINQQIVMSTPVAVPTISEQELIVSRIEEAFQAIDRIQQQYEIAKTRLDQLDRAILAQAFRGDLVPQDPTDEPAAVLLDRIRQARQQISDNKIKKPKTSRKQP